MEETGEIQPKIVLKIWTKCKDKSNIITENRDLDYFHANPIITVLREWAFCPHETSESGHRNRIDLRSPSRAV